MIQCSNASYFDPSNKFVWANNSFLIAVTVELTVVDNHFHIDSQFFIH